MTAWVHDFQFTFTAPAEEIFAALTEASQLEAWFAERVEIGSKPGEPYRFWGRHTYGTPRASDAEQSIVVFEPPRRLVYTWTIEGVATEVELVLSPGESKNDEPATKVELHHRIADALPVVRSRELIDDLWRLQFGNLASHLAGGPGILLPDYDDPSPEVRCSIEIDAPREKVFRALVEPAILEKWIASKAEVDPRSGGNYSYGWRYSVGGREIVGGPSRILELVENERLVTDWPDWRGDESVPVQKIAWLLEDLGGRTRVTVVHSGFVRTADISDFPFGWPGFLDALRLEIERPAG